MKKLIFALIAGTAVMSAAQAQTTTSPRMYLGAGVSTAESEYRIPGSNDESSRGFKGSGKIFGGAEIDQTYGVEAGYTDFRKSRASYTVNGVPGRAEADGYGAYIAGKATMPVTDKASVYAKLGVAHTKREMTSPTPGVGRKVSDNAGYGALGAQYAINQQVSLIAEYERFGKKADFGTKPDLWTIGAKYNF
jgi:OOP family OmpA-OmpF porin